MDMPKDPPMFVVGDEVLRQLSPTHLSLCHWRICDISVGTRGSSLQSHAECFWQYTLIRLRKNENEVRESSVLDVRYCSPDLLLLRNQEAQDPDLVERALDVPEADLVRTRDLGVWWGNTRWKELTAKESWERDEPATPQPEFPMAAVVEQKSRFSPSGVSHPALLRGVVIGVSSRPLKDQSGGLRYVYRIKPWGWGTPSIFMAEEDLRLVSEDDLHRELQPEVKRARNEAQALRRQLQRLEAQGIDHGVSLSIGKEEKNADA